MSDEQSSLMLLRAAQSGDDDALNALCARYLDWVTDVARGRLMKLGRTRNAEQDAEDVAIESLAQLVAKIRRGDFQGLNEPQQLRALVVTITYGKLSDMIIRKRTLPNLDTPEQFAISQQASFEFRDWFARLLDSLPRDELRTVATLVLDEKTQKDIARELNCNVRTVQRLFSELRSLWQSLLPPNSGDN